MPAPAPNCAGGIVFRDDGGEDGEAAAYLLVQASDNPLHWLFPKGHIDPGETDRTAALREVAEEAGVAAAILGEVGIGSYVHDGETLRTRYFLMRYRGEVAPLETRGRRWRRFAEAQATLSFDDLRRLLRTADALRRRCGSRQG